MGPLDTYLSNGRVGTAVSGLVAQAVARGADGVEQHAADIVDRIMISPRSVAERMIGSIERGGGRPTRDGQHEVRLAGGRQASVVRRWIDEPRRANSPSASVQQIGTLR